MLGEKPPWYIWRGWKTQRSLHMNSLQSYFGTVSSFPKVLTSKVFPDVGARTLPQFISRMFNGEFLISFGWWWMEKLLSSSDFQPFDQRVRWWLVISITDVMQFFCFQKGSQLQSKYILHESYCSHSYCGVIGEL